MNPQNPDAEKREMQENGRGFAFCARPPSA